MDSWLGLCGLLAAVISMMLDVAQFWKRVTVSTVGGAMITFLEANLGGLPL